jgi:NADH:ubiquinone oxidoreductase subunit E
MAVEKKNGQVVTNAVQAAIERHGTSRDELIPILNQINLELGYLPPEALQLVGENLKLPQSRLFSVASFYRMLSTKPRGRHVIQFCESAPCHVVGGRQVWQKLQEELKLKAGETSPDGKWSLVTVSCLGVCAVGPVMVIDEEIFGNLTPEQIPDILARYE